MNDFTIRPIEGEADYEFGVRLLDAWFGERFGISHEIDQMRNLWKQRDDPVKRVYIAEMEGKQVASLNYSEIPSDDGQRRFVLGLLIMPEYHSATSLNSLFIELQNMVARHNPDEIKMGVDDFLEEHIALAESQAFERTQRDQFSTLDLDKVDFSIFEDVVTRVKESGIRLVTLPEYEQENPEYKAAITELTSRIHKDVPGFESVVTTIERLEERVFHNPTLLRDAFILALDTNQLVGMTYVTRFGNEKVCLTQLTGVIRSHRRRGITTAMKVAAFKTVQDMGFERILTNNEENNPMYQINLKFGFEPGPALFHYVKQMSTG